MDQKDLHEKSIELAKEFIQNKLDQEFTIEDLTSGNFSHVDPKNIITIGYTNKKGKPYPRNVIRITKIDGVLCTWVWKVRDIYKMITQPSIL